MKNKIIGLVMSVVLAFTFTGCSAYDGNEPEQPTATVTETTEVEVTPEPTETPTLTPEPEDTPSLDSDQADEIYVGVVRDQYPNIGLSDDEIIEVGSAACMDLDNGATVEDLLAVIGQNATSVREGEQFAFMVGAAIPIYCPEYQDQIPGLDSGGTI